MAHDFDQKTKELGQYYTPSSIVNFIVENTIGSLLKSSNEYTSNEITILDPSVGKGAFLIWASEYLESLQIQKRKGKDKNSSRKREIIVNQLYGIDIDSQRVNDSRQALGYPEFSGNIKQFDALIPAVPSIRVNVSDTTPLYFIRRRYKKAYIEKNADVIAETQPQILELERIIRKNTTQAFDGDRNEVFPLSWEEIFPETGGKFHVIIGNPPWGADITRIKNQISYLKSATSQMDSWSLFIERSIIGLRKGGYLGLVVPNTLLLNPNYTQIRSILLSQCQITYLVNLGEGIFPGVAQPAMIIIAKKTPYNPTHKISVIPSISKQMREEILNGQVKFDTFCYISCLQSRFKDNINNEFDIFSLESDSFVKNVEKDLYTDKKEVISFGTIVKNGRGVEIGKKGKIVQCPICKKWSSPPRTKRKCRTFNCSYKLSTLAPEVEIVHEFAKDPSIDQPFLVGAQIQRYFTHPNKYISTQYPGINFKTPKLYQSPKLLVRKTGKEMKWVIDYQDRWVSQVVYIFQLKKNMREKNVSISLEYLLGILNSQMMKKYVNSKFLDPGRTEFPHFVQKSILQLPIKIPKSEEEIKLSGIISEMASKLQLLYQQEYEEGLTDKRTYGLKGQIQKNEEEIEKAVKSLYSIIT
jgi:hypothetical protein